jgi:hypothetical protein
MRKMSQSAEGDAHVQLQLGLYVLGALSSAEDISVERHLLNCETCRLECDELSEAALMLSWLPADEFAERRGTWSQARQETSRITAGARASGAGDRSARKRSKRYGTRSHVAVTVAAAAVLVVAAGVWWQRLPATSPDGGLLPTPVAEVAASSTDDATGAMMSVHVREVEGGTEVRAVLVGLRAGVEFQLAAVDAVGTQHMVIRGTAAGGPEVVVGDTDLALGNIRFVVVLGSDGSVLLSVQVPAAAPPR